MSLAGEEKSGVKLEKLPEKAVKKDEREQPEV